MFAANRVSRLLGAVAGAGLMLACFPAEANQHHHRHRSAQYAHYFRSVAPVIQCVAFAKQDAGIEISGNARDWWSNAAGIYERGSRPESGSVLSFRENDRMPLGHVAVVSGVEDSRTIFIDQSHWNSRGIARNVVVKDVSDDNDWSAVRVQLAGGDGFGSIYPTHGFIYPRPDREPQDRDLGTPARAVRTAMATPSRARPQGGYATEIAEAPRASRPLDLTIGDISAYAPSRAVR